MRCWWKTQEPQVRDEDYSAHVRPSVPRGDFITLSGKKLAFCHKVLSLFFTVTCKHSRKACGSVAKSRLTLCDPMECNTPDSPVLHCLLEFAQTHVHWVGDAIQPFHPLSPPSPPALNLSQHQGLFQRVGSSHQVAKVLEFQLQHQSFQKSCFRTEITKFIQLYRSKSRFMVA